MYAAAGVTGVTSLPESIGDLAALTTASFGHPYDGSCTACDPAPTCCPTVVGVAWSTVGGTCENEGEVCPLAQGGRCGQGFYTDVAAGTCVICPTTSVGQYLSSIVAALGGTTLLVSSHVMDEADHCADLLLMRDGRILAHTTPTRLRKDTGCQSLEEAFLSIIRRGTAAEAAPTR